jgi:predicted DNA-binding transcriptional regulator AlpA
MIFRYSQPVSRRKNTMAISTDEKVLWTAKETAERLGISVRTLYSHTAPRGTLQCVKIGVRTGYRPETVDAWLRKREGKDTQVDQ